MRGLRFALGTGAVSWAWSEVGFWAQFRTGDNPAIWVLTWLLYSLVSYVVMRVVGRYGATRPAAVLLVGALYGWLVEGTIAPSIYETIPFSLIWTAVAWHALLTVVLGWYVVPAALRAGGRRALAWCSGVGLAWGLWGVGWWGVEPDDGQHVAGFHPVSYAVFVTIVSGAAAAGYALQWAHRPAPDTVPARRPLVVVAVLLLLWSIPIVLLPIPWAPLVLAPLVGLAILGLRRLGSSRLAPLARQGPGAWLAQQGPAWGVPWRRLGPLALVPTVAWPTSLVASWLSGGPTGRGPAYVGFVAAVGLLTLAGGVALLGAAVAAWRAPGRSSSHPAHLEAASRSA